METRNYLANASATPPAAPAAPSNGYPQPAVPGTNEATTPGPHWFFKVGEELRAIIVAAGLTPDDDVLNQILDALQGGFGLAASLTDTGYITLPGGVILQWGTASMTTDNTHETFNFNLAFPTAALRVMASDYSNGAGGADIVAIGPTLTTSTFQLTGKTGTGTPANVNWFAIGY